jgi:hypothetical protein
MFIIFNYNRIKSTIQTNLNCTISTWTTPEIGHCRLCCHHHLGLQPCPCSDSHCFCIVYKLQCCNIDETKELDADGLISQRERNCNESHILYAKGNIHFCLVVAGKSILAMLLSDWYCYCDIEIPIYQYLPGNDSI